MKSVKSPLGQLRVSPVLIGRAIMTKNDSSILNYLKLHSYIAPVDARQLISFDPKLEATRADYGP